MKARTRISKPSGIINFDLGAPIEPMVGAGGVSFENKLSDFEYLLTEKFFDPAFRPDISFEMDKEYFLFTLFINRTALEVQFDLISGKINFISCGKGYKGNFNGTVSPGAEANGDFFKQNDLSFDLDLYWFSKYPFDGLVVYPPAELREECWEAAASTASYPRFTVKKVFILNSEYATKQFGSEENGL